MHRYKIITEYDGREFVGWQRQDTGLGVQQVIETGIKAFSGENATVLCAGRTDAGVHARGQVAHFDLERQWPAWKVRDAINMQTRPHAVSILSAEETDEEFHARFSAKERVYQYRIINRRAPLTLDRGLYWRVNLELDAEAMNEAAQVLVGHHDFTSFRATKCQSKSPRKTLDSIRVERNGEMIDFYVRARSFLHHQVRNIVGTLRLVGEGKWTKDDVQKALDACDRRAAGPKAPSDGLYLMKVEY